MATSRFCLIGCALALVFPGALRAQVTAEQAIETAHQIYSLPSCDSKAALDEIVVCASNNSKNRLETLPHLTRQFEHERIAVPRVAANAGLARECGVFQGQRRCGIRELRSHGYGGGSVPIRALVQLLKKVVEPDSEIGPLSGYPVSPQELGE